MRVNIPKNLLKLVEREYTNNTSITLIGEGGFKKVYAGKINGEFNQAIKIIPINNMSGGEDNIAIEEISRIKREIRILEECSSPFLVKLGNIEPNIITDENNNYIIYSEELIEGVSLRNRINEGKRPTEKELIDLAKCILDVIENLWFNQKKWIHRDIKPDNIIETENISRPYVLLDLGIAFSVNDTRLTQNSINIPGTTLYIAPEMLKPGFRSTIDYRADLYTMALTIYEYATGNHPFKRKNDVMFTTLTRIYNDPVPSLSISRNDLNPTFCNLIDQMLKKLPALRPANLNMIRAKLEI